MEKNRTRKGLAISSAAAVVAASTLAFAPAANAETGLKLELESGTNFAVPIEQAIYLKTSAIGTKAVDTEDFDQLKYKVTTAGGFDVKAANGNSKANAISDAVSEAAGDAELSAVYAADTWASGDTLNFLELTVFKADGSTQFAEDDDSVTVTVQAFLDANEDGAIASDEWSSTAVTVTFMDIDDIQLTTVLTQPVLGDDALDVAVTSSNINIAQSTITMDLSSTGTTAGAASETVSSGTYSSDDSDLTFASSDDGTATTDVTSKVPADYPGSGNDLVVEAGSFSAQAQVSGTNVGNASTRAVTATTVATVTAAVAAGDDNEALNSNDTDARSGSGSVTLKYTVKTSAPAAIEDKTVTLTLEENAGNSLASGASVTVGGETLTNSNNGTVQKVTVTGVTDADGEVEFVVSYSGAVKTNVLKATATADGVSSGADTITFEDAAATTVYNLDVTGTSTSELYYVKDTAFSLNYALLDQFGTLFTGANHSAEVSDGTVTATAVYSNGRATVDFAGFATAAAKTMTAKTFKSGADQSVGTTTEVTILAAANAAVSSISITETDSFGTAASPRPLMLKDWNNADIRIGEDAPASVANGITATVALKDANGNATRGPITISGTDLLFVDDDDQVYSSGSITVQSSTTGTYAVEVFSNTAGAKTLTVTSGGVTKTDTVYFQSAKDDTGTTLTASAPAYAAPGSTFAVVFTLTDKYGNPVTTDSAATNFNDGSVAPAFSVTYSGPGLYMGTLPTKTDANGQARVSVLLGQNDTGSVAVVASYDGDTTSSTNTTTATVTTSTTAGTAPAAQKVNAGSFKGYVAVYARGYEGQRLSAKIGNDWVIVDPIVNNQGDDLHRTTDFTGAGVDIAVRIYIDRVLIDTINLTTK